MSPPSFEIVTTTAGAISIRDNESKEIMHNPVGPWLEANTLYIAQSRLAEKLSETRTDEVLVFDVGLGAAANALAALHCSRRLLKRKLHLISFEKNLELLKFALAHADQFSHFHACTDAITTLLTTGIFKEQNFCWELRHGDFLSLIESEKEKAQIIFYDPYSPRKNQEMWTTACFKKLIKRCRPDACLYTYSQATPIRSALLAAGFFVGEGVGIGLKETTTEAALTIENLRLPLDKRWLTRFQSSHTPYPLDCEPGQEKEIRDSILHHPQFSSH